MIKKPIKFKIKTVIEFEFDEEALCEAVEKALIPEARLELRNVKSKLFYNDGGVRLIIEALDPSSFRAALNALLRLISALIKAIEDLKSSNNASNI